MAKRKAKRKTKRKATPAQLRALAKGRRTLKKKRAAKKRTRRRNPAYGVPGYMHARSAIRKGTTGRRRNPNRNKRPMYAIKANGRFFTGKGFTAKKGDAAHWANLSTCESVAQSLADATGKTCSIVNA